YYDIDSKSYLPVPGAKDYIVLDTIRAEKTVWKNNGISLIDLGDGILNAEIHTKMNTIDADVIHGIHKAIDLAEKQYKGLVIANDGDNFSAGANLGMIFMLTVEQDVDELNNA